MQIVIDIDENVFTRLFDNGIEDYEIVNDDLFAIAKAIRKGTVLENKITSNNLCNSCTNIGCEFQSGIVRTKCAFYMPPHIEPDNCGNYVVQPTYEARLKAEREKIAEDIADKMAYMGSCLNERNIILGIITGKRETLDSLCSICKSESCVSNGTAISKTDYEARLKADMVDILGQIRTEIEWLRLHKAEFLTSNNKVCIDSQEVLDIIDKYREEIKE